MKVWKQNKSRNVWTIVLLAVMAASLVLTGCGSGTAPSASSSASSAGSSATTAVAYSQAKDLDGKVVAAQSGTTGADWVLENLPNATLKNFNMASEALASLVAGDVEAVFFDEPVAVEQVATTYQNCVVLQTIPTGEQYGFAVAKNNTALEAKVNSALQTLKANGQFETIFKKWFPTLPVPALKEAAGAPAAGGEMKLVEPGVLTVASDCDYPPFIKLEGDQPAGYEYELLQAVAAELGLTLKYLPPQNFDGILALVASGTTCDLGVSSFTINDERLQLVDFCTSYCDSNQACVILKSKAAG